MLINPQVPLHRLILSLSEALDCVHSDVADHQHRVTYIATRIGRHMGLGKDELAELFCACAFHDIGLIGAENKLHAAQLKQVEETHWHCRLGYELLHDNPLFCGAAELILHHHVRWAHGAGGACQGRAVPRAAHILALADRTERFIDRRVPVLQQGKDILAELGELAGAQFQPECVEALRAVAVPEAFWFDCVSDRIYSVLLDQIAWPSLAIDGSTLGPVAKIFARIVDASSPWTAVHTAGVTATSVALAERLSLSPRELDLMRAAGYLHDLGKLTVPAAILDKHGSLTPEELAVMRGHTYHTFRILKTIGGMPQITEWAAFHHEKLDGRGYPFHHTAEVLTLGARIVAVADVFTAVKEDRPYRKGMSNDQAVEVVDGLVKSGGLDGDIVGVLNRNYEAIDSIRQDEQAQYAEEQQRLAAIAEALGKENATLQPVS